ncbi:MAG: hypothetical protein ACYC6T_08180 [Thermoleophilia bacterium]
MAARTKETPGQALERVRPQERALVQAASELGILKEAGGALMIDLSSPELAKIYNILAPVAMLVQADPNFTPAISILQLDPDPRSKDYYPIDKAKAASGDYPAKEGTYALSKRPLDMIGNQAGIEDIGPEIVYFGDHHENVRVTWRARVRRPDGTYKPLVGSREWIEADEKAKLEANPPAWAQKSESAYKKWWADSWLGAVKKHRLGNTETKARLRAYRQHLHIKTYTAEELQKPWLVPSTTATFDTSNPAILRMIFTGGEQATDLLYGPAALPAHTDTIDVDATEHEDPPVSVDTETGEIFPDEPDEPEGHGERPATDPIIPSGDHKGHPISVIAREHPDYVRDTLLTSGSAKWGTASEAWLTYWGHATGGDDDDVQF